METVLKLRSQYGRPQKTLTDPDKYIDESYYRKALARPATPASGLPATSRRLRPKRFDTERLFV